VLNDTMVAQIGRGRVLNIFWQKRADVPLATKGIVAITSFPRPPLISLRAIAIGLLALPAISLMTASAVEAACSPAASAGAPPSGTTVTCSGSTTDQNAPAGYGDGSQDGLTINVVAGASVAGTGAGFALGTGNNINNSGTIQNATPNPTSFNGISTLSSANFTLTNNGSGMILGASTDPNAVVIGVNVGNLQGSNAGNINVTGSGNETVGMNVSTVSNFTNTGTISAAGSTVNGTFGILGLTNVSVTNSGTISADGGTGSTGTAISNNTTGTLTVINQANGHITGTENNAGGGTTNFSFGVFAAGTGAAIITNAGTIHGDDIAIASLSTTSNSIVNTNTGMISGGGFGAIRIFGAAATNIENGGIITETAGNAIRFATGVTNTLTLDPGSAITGNVVAAGADIFQLGGAGADTFNVAAIGAAAQYQGFSTFNKIGTSSWTLTGTNATAMPWTISAGTLNVNGTLANSTMAVNGGVLGGTGTVGATTINSGGTFMPGSGTPGTFMNVSGNLAFASGALYLVQLNPATASFAQVTGTAAPGGATVNATYANGSYVSKQYTILTATGGVSGTFGSLVNTNLPANFSTSLSYDAHDAFLNLTLNFIPPSSPNFGGGLNGNQQAVGNALTNFFNSTGSIPLVFGTLTPAGLTQASGELATGSQQTTFNAMNQFLNLLTDPFIGGRGDGPPAGAGATPFAEEIDAANAYAAKDPTRSKSERDAYAAIYRKAPLAAPFVPSWSVWAAGYGGSQTTSGNAVLGSNDTTSRIAGTAVGADYRFSPFTIAGFAIAGGGTNFSVNNLGTGRSDLFQAGAFVRHTVGPAYFTAALAYGWQDLTTDRTVTIAGIDQLRARFNANAFSGRLEDGYRFATMWMGITPYAAAQFTTFDLPAYAEQALVGANTFALAYNAKSVTDTRTEVGLRTDKSWAMPDSIFTLRGRFAWAHDYNPDRAIGATFQTLPGASFAVNGAAQAHDSALTTASAEVKWINGWSAAATFEGEFSDVTRSYAGKGVVRYAW
jgi:uncharacterized protein with beta-barrel porin domain